MIKVHSHSLTTNANGVIYVTLLLHFWTLQKLPIYYLMLILSGYININIFGNFIIILPVPRNVSWTVTPKAARTQHAIRFTL